MFTRKQAKRYKRVKLKYSIDVRTSHDGGDDAAGTLRVPLRFG